MKPDDEIENPGQPRVSIVIPVYCHTIGHAKYLKETLESVAAQTFKDTELIIVDDLSPVDINPIVKSVQGLPYTRIIRNQANIRHAESRNVGTNTARGDMIAYLDHDDIWLPNKIERQLDVLNKNPDAAMAFCEMEIFGEHADRLKLDQSIIPERPGFYWFICHGNYTLSASAVMIKKQAMIDIGGFDSRYSTCDDFDAWLKVLAKAPIIHIPEKLAKYRLHLTNENYNVDRLNDNKLLTSLIWRYWKKAAVREKMLLIPRLARKYAGRAYFTIFRFRKFRN